MPNNPLEQTRLRRVAQLNALGRLKTTSEPVPRNPSKRQRNLSVAAQVLLANHRRWHRCHRSGYPPCVLRRKDLGCLYAWAHSSRSRQHHPRFALYRKHSCLVLSLWCGRCLFGQSHPDSAPSFEPSRSQTLRFVVTVSHTVVHTGLGTTQS